MNCNTISNWRTNWTTSSGTKPLSIQNAQGMNELISLAIDRAHAPSVIRALSTGGKSTKIAKENAKKYLMPRMIKLFMQPITAMPQVKYDAFAKEACEKIKECYHKEGIIDYTLGNAQKLLNMTVKYILSSSLVDPTWPVWDVVHIPIDARIMVRAKKKLGVYPMPKAWSKTDDWTSIQKYQTALRTAVGQAVPNKCSMEWEVENW